MLGHKRRKEYLAPVAGMHLRGRYNFRKCLVGATRHVFGRWSTVGLYRLKPEPQNIALLIQK